MTGFAWWWPMFSLLRIPAQWGCLLCESGTIYVVSFYLLSKYNSLINLGVGLKCLHTSVFIKTTSLEVLPTKAKEDLSPHEIRLFSTGHQSRIYYHYHHHFFLLSLLLLLSSSSKQITWIFGCSWIFAILLPGFYQWPETTERYFNTVSIFMQWTEFCKAPVEICETIINIKGKHLL